MRCGHVARRETDLNLGRVVRVAKLGLKIEFETWGVVDLQEEMWEDEGESV